MVEYGSKTCCNRQIYPQGSYLLAGALTANWVEASYSTTLYCVEAEVANVAQSMNLHLCDAQTSHCMSENTVS
jgi:hypothetical protein